MIIEISLPMYLQAVGSQVSLSTLIIILKANEILEVIFQSIRWSQSMKLNLKRYRSWLKSKFLPSRRSQGTQVSIWTRKGKISLSVKLPA